MEKEFGVCELEGCGKKFPIKPAMFRRRFCCDEHRMIVWAFRKYLEFMKKKVTK